MTYQDRREGVQGMQDMLRTAGLMAVALVLTAIIYSYFDAGGSAPLTRSFAVSVGLVAMAVLAARVMRTFVKKRRVGTGD